MPDCQTLPQPNTELRLRGPAGEHQVNGSDNIIGTHAVPTLQTSGQIAGWLHWRGFPIASPAAQDPRGLINEYRRAA